MSPIDKKKKYFEFLINEYDEGRAKIRGDHPQEIKVAVDTFFKAGKILVDNPESGNIPSEYVCLLYTSPSPRDATLSRMPSSA